MRNLFAVDLTDEDNPLSPADAFVRDKVPEYQEQRLGSSVEETGEVVEKAVKGPLALRILTIVFAVFAVIGLGVFSSITEEDGVPAIIEWGTLAVGAVSLVIVVLLGVIQHRRAKKALESDEVTQLTDNLDRLSENSKQLLGVPADAAELDVFGYSYEMKRGKEKCLHKQFAPYITSRFNVFVEGGELMLANDVEKYAIPLSAITGVRVIRKKTQSFLWMKDEKPKSATYKPYKIRFDDENDVFTVRAIYSLDITQGGETFELVVPDYDWELVLQPLLAPHITLEPVEV